MMWTDALRFLINTVFGLVVYTALLRFIMQWLRAPFRNPLGQATIALTDWAVKPLRRVLPGSRRLRLGVAGCRVDRADAVARALAAMGAGCFRRRSLAFVAALALVELVKAALWIMIGAIFIQAILSWVAPDGPLAGVLNALTFRVLAPIRRVLPPLGGTLDLSPLIAIVLAQLLLMLPVAWLEQAVAQI